MSRSKKTVVILVDDKNRDLPTTALIAWHLERRGIRCHLEPLEAYRGVLAAHRPDAIVFNHLLGSHLVAYSKKLNAMGVMVCVLPNEGINYDKAQREFIAQRFHSKARIDLFLSWNQELKDCLVENHFGDEGRIEVVGVPRFDFYFPPWSKTVAQPESPAGRPRILICTNFVFAKFQELPPVEADKFFHPLLDRVPRYKEYRDAIQANHRSRSRFFDFLNEIVGARKFSVVLRPHPREDATPYLRWHKALDPALREKVVIDQGPNITGQILACDLSISCETCTTALESWIAGKPTLQLDFDRHPVYFYPEQADINVLCGAPAEIVPLIDRELARGSQPEHAAGRARHLKTWCDAPRGDSASRIADLLQETVEKRPSPDFSGLNLSDRRRALKLKGLKTFGFPYHFDPFLPVKSALFKRKYSIKEFAYHKSIKPGDVASIRTRFDEILRGQS